MTINANRSKNNLIGIMFMIAASMILAFNSVLINKFASQFKPITIYFISNIVAISLISTYVLCKERKIPETKGMKIYALRGIFFALSMIMWYYSLQMIPTTDATALSYLTPLLNIIGAVIFLKEKITKGGVLAIFIGLSGVMIILRPGFQEISFGFYLCIITTILWATADLFAKKQAKDHAIIPQLFYTYFVTTLLASVFFYASSEKISLDDLKILIPFGITPFLGVICVLNAYKRANFAVIIPFDFSRIIFASLFAYLINGEIISIFAIFGSVFISLSAIYVGQQALNSSKIKESLK